MDFAYYALTPFTWLLMFFYQFFNSYGVALILFALVVKLILYPVSYTHLTLPTILLV